MSSCEATLLAEHLIIVSRSMPPDIGGYQRQLALLAPHLARHFASLTWIGAVRDRPGGRFDVHGIDRAMCIRAHLLPRRIRSCADVLVVLGAIALVGSLAARRAQVRLLLLSPTMVGGSPLVRVARSLGVRVIVRYPTAGDLKRRRGHRVATQAGVCAIAPSPAQVDEVDDVDVVLVPNAVEVPPPRGDAGEHAGLRVLYVGRLVARKRVGLLLEAWRQVGSREGWSLRLVGGGGDERDSVEADVRALAADLAFGVRLDGRLPDARRAMEEADVFVFPSSREGMPNSVLEALAAGLPVVAELQRATEWFREIPPIVDWDGTVPGLVEVLVDLAAEPERRAQLSAAGRQFVAEHHAPATAAATIAAL